MFTQDGNNMDENIFTESAIVTCSIKIFRKKKTTKKSTTYSKEAWVEIQVRGDLFLSFVSAR